MAEPKFEKGANSREMIKISETRELMNLEHLKAMKQALQAEIGAKQARLAEIEGMLQSGVGLKCWTAGDITA